MTLGNLGREPVEVECFAQAQVRNYVSRHSEDVAFAGFSRISIPEVRECVIGITSEKLRRPHRRFIWARAEVGGPRRIALNFPVRGPAGIIKYARSLVVEAD